MFFPRSLAAVFGLGRLPARGAATLDTTAYIHAALPVSVPVTVTCLVHVAVFTQECQPPRSALRSPEIRRRPWACKGTCYLFAGPMDDTSLSGDSTSGTVELRTIEGRAPQMSGLSS